MKTLGIRDIIGPIMIGPSSSHTAGALRIALMTRKLLSAEPVEAEFFLYGSFAHTYHGHGTDRALLAGMLGLQPDDERIRDSFELAEGAHLTYEFRPLPNDETDHPNTVEIRVRDLAGSTIRVRGESIGGGAARIREIDGVEVLLSGEYHSLVVKQRDARGILAFIAGAVAEAGINIATTRLFRDKRGTIAYTVMETDDALPDTLRDALLKNPDIYSVSMLPSDRASELHAPMSVEEELAAGIEPTGFGTEMGVEEASVLFERLDFASGAELLAYCEETGLPISDAICRRERCLLAMNGIAVDDTKRYLNECLRIMRASVETSLAAPHPSMGGLIGGEGIALSAYEQRDDALFGAADGALMSYAIAAGMAVLETNASMGRIVAAPTAGSAGVVPAVLFALQRVKGFTDLQLQRALANAAAIGMLIARTSTVAGAEGGCQAEVGTASAMAASAAVELMGGSPAQCFAAASTALSNLMGLVCDPIGGLVEAPCQKRNAIGPANSLVAAQLALAGVTNIISFDETVWAMDTVGRSLPFELRESALGGLAATPTACALCAKDCGA